MAIFICDRSSCVCGLFWVCHGTIIWQEVELCPEALWFSRSLGCFVFMFKITVLNFCQLYKCFLKERKNSSQQDSLFEIPCKELRHKVKTRLPPFLCHKRVYITLCDVVRFIFEIHLTHVPCGLRDILETCVSFDTAVEFINPSYT